MEIVQSLRSAGLVIRHPIEVFHIVWLPTAGHGLDDFSTTNGARLIDSTPPARMMSASPASIARDPWITASTDDPQRRLTRDAGHARREAREQRAEARDVAVVFARLVGVAEDHVVDPGRVDAGALDDRAHHDGGEVVGADARRARRRRAPNGVRTAS